MGVILVREKLDKLIRLGQTASLHQLLIRRIGIAPAKVFLDGTGEKHILLQHHSHLIPEGPKIIVPYVLSAHHDITLSGIIKPGNQLDQRGLGRTGAAQDTHGFTALDVEVNVGEHKALGVLLVFEVYVIEIDVAVRHLHHGLRRVVKGTLLLQYLRDTLAGLNGHGHHHENHGNHHQADEDLEAVGQKSGELSHIQKAAPGADDGVGTEAQHEDHHHIKAELHHGVVEGQDLLGLGEVAAELLGCPVELLLLIFLTHEGLHHPHTVDVLLYRLIQTVVLFEHRMEQGHGQSHHESEATAQKGNGQHKDPGHASAHHKGHGKGKDHHQGRTEGKPGQHHVGELHIGYIRGHSRHQRSGVETVDVLEGEALNSIEHVLPQIPCKAGGCRRAIVAGRDAEQQRNHGHDHQDHTIVKNHIQTGTRLDLIDQLRNDEGDNAFHHHFTADHQRCHGGCEFEFPYRFRQDLHNMHKFVFSFLLLPQKKDTRQHPSHLRRDTTSGSPYNIGLHRERFIASAAGPS